MAWNNQGTLKSVYRSDREEVRELTLPMGEVKKIDQAPTDKNFKSTGKHMTMDYQQMSLSRLAP